MPVSKVQKFVVVTMVLGCSQIGPQPRSNRPSDLESQIFWVALQGHLSTFVHGASLFVDPRPIDLSDADWLLTPADYLIDQRAVARRLEVLESMGLDTASILPFREDCEAVAAYPDGKDVNRCSEAATVTILALGVSAGIPGSRSHAIRLLTVQYGDRDRRARVYELILHRRGGPWRVCQETMLGDLNDPPGTGRGSSWRPHPDCL